MRFMPLINIEEAALNAWPAPRQMLYDGWVLRFTGGNSKRVNSVNILAASKLPFGEKITFCEAVFRGQGLPVLFRLPEPFTPLELPKVLLEEGYVSFDPTLVLGREIEMGGSLPEGLKIRHQSDEEWLPVYVQITKKTMASLVFHKAVLKGIVPKKSLIAFYMDEIPVACGMGVVSGDFLGYFSIFTETSVRRQGFAQAVMTALSRWGIEQGATFGYLQVERDNLPARAMYQKLGFARLYGYEYWKKIEKSQPHEANASKS